MARSFRGFDEYEEIAKQWVEAGLSRRQLLRFMAGGTSAAALSIYLAACGGSTSPATTSSSAGTTTSSSAGTTTSASSTKSSTSSGAGASPSAGQPATQIPAGSIQQNVTMTIPIVTTIDITLDPQKSQNYLTLGNLLPYVYGGFLTYDQDAHVMQDLAEHYEKSDDGLTYRFTLRKDAKFGNGRQVVADDFIYSWKRALDPKSPSPAINFLELIKGYEEYSKGQTTDFAGARKIDDQTVEVTLSKPYNFFTSYMSIYPWFVVDQQLIEKYGDSNNTDWTNHNPYGTGPWRVTKYDPTTSIEMEPNPNWYGQHSPSVTKIVWPILKGPVAPNTALNLYKGDQAQVFFNLPLSLLDAIQKDFSDEMRWITVGGTQSVAMSFSKKPFDNVLVRRAFGLAIDRDTFDNQVWRGTRQPTTSFEPPAIKNYQAPHGIDYNLDEAKKTLAAAGFPNGQGLPPITFYMASETAAEDINRWRALADMWNKGLGANVTLDTSMTNSQIIDKRTAEKGFQMEIMGWINITETPQLMSEVFQSDAIYMKNRFDWGIQVPPMSYNGVTYDPTADSKKFDDLTHQADLEQDETKRNDLYKQAEQLILQDAVYVPFGNYRFPALVKKNVKGLKQGAFYYNFPMPVDKDVVFTK